MILGIGSDFVEVKRIGSAIEKNQRFLTRIFTENERHLFDERPGNLYTIGTNFALKEATSKALGTGFSGFNFCDIEVLRDSRGKPIIRLLNGALERAENIGVSQIHATSSHDKGFVMAYCIVEGV